MTTLTKKGITVKVVNNVGVGVKFRNTDYETVGAKIVDRNAVFESGVILKVQQPFNKEVSQFAPNSTLISFKYPAQNMANIAYYKRP